MQTRLLFYSYVMNIFDLTATMSLISQFGIEAEGNPIGRILLSDPHIAVAVKVFGIAALLFILYIFRNRKLAKTGIYLIFFAFLLLTAYHIYIITMLKA